MEPFVESVGLELESSAHDASQLPVLEKKKLEPELSGRAVCRELKGNAADEGTEKGAPNLQRVRNGGGLGPPRDRCRCRGPSAHSWALAWPLALPTAAGRAGSGAPGHVQQLGEMRPGVVVRPLPAPNRPVGSLVPERHPGAPSGQGLGAGQTPGSGNRHDTPSAPGR